MAKKPDPEIYWLRGTRLECPIPNCKGALTVAIPIAKGSAACQSNHPKIQVLITAEEKAERAKQTA